MPSPFTTRAIAQGARRIPGLRQIPAARLLTIADVGLIARDHIGRLTPAERRRLLGLMGKARGRPSQLGLAERGEFALLVAKLEPRLFAGEAAQRLSPVPLPRRVVRGRRRR